MINVVGEFIRPDVRTPFYTPTTDFAKYFNETYVKTGLRKKITYSLSDDRLTMQILSTWKDEESYDKFLVDSYVQIYLIRPRRKYCFQNGIQVSSTSIIFLE